MNLEQQRALAHKLCRDARITVQPYGNAWWLRGEGINRVIGELAGLNPAGLKRFAQTPRY